MKRHKRWRAIMKNLGFRKIVCYDGTIRYVRCYGMHYTQKQKSSNAEMSEYANKWRKIIDDKNRVKRVIINIEE